jgi:hypothetical protein
MAHRPREALRRPRRAVEPLWAGALSVHDRRARLTIDARPGNGTTRIAWRLTR